MAYRSRSRSPGRRGDSDVRYDSPRRTNRSPSPRRYRSPPRRRSHSRSPPRRSGSSREETRNSSSLFVGNLPYHLRERDVIDIFEKFGPVKLCTVGVNKKTGQSMGYCFISFEDRRDAEDAYDKYQGYNLDGRRLRIDWDAGLERKQQSRGDRPPRRHASPGRRRSRSPRRRSPSPGATRRSRSPPPPPPRRRSRSPVGGSSGGDRKRSRSPPAAANVPSRRSRSPVDHNEDKKRRIDD